MAIFGALAGIVSAVTAAATAVGIPSVLVTAGINVLVGTGLSYAGQLLAGKPSVPRQNSRAVVSQSTADRKRGYGRMLIGGVRSFYDSKDGALHQIILTHHGEIDGFEAFLIGDTEVEVDASGEVQTRPWLRSSGSQVRILSRVGTDQSPAYAEMISAWPGVWTDQHQAKGIATAYALFRPQNGDHFNELFPQSYNTPITARARLSRCYDPRDRRWKWTRNAGLVIRDYLLSPDGFGLDPDDVNDESFAAFADISDQLVDRANGDPEPRYSIDGTYSLLADRKGTLQRMFDACDAEPYEDGEGRIGIRGGIWTEPTVTIYADDVLAHDLELGADRFAAFNRLRVFYTNPKTFEEAEGKEWNNFEDQARRGVVEDRVDFDMVTSASQALRLARIFERKNNPTWRGTITTNLAGLAARGERIIRLVLPELSIDETFLVTSHGIRADLTGCEIGLSSLSADAYAFNPLDEGAEIPDPADTKPSLTLPVPVFTLSSELRAFTPTSSAPVAIADAVAARADLTIFAQCRLAPAGSWEAMSAAELRAVSGPLVQGQTYEVRARWLTARGTAGDWSASQPITV